MQDENFETLDRFFEMERSRFSFSDGTWPEERVEKFVMLCEIGRQRQLAGRVTQMVREQLEAGSFDSKRFYPIVKDIHTRFLRPATSDVTAEVRLEDGEITSLCERAMHDGKVDHRLTLELRDTEGVVVAVTESVFQLRARSAERALQAERST